MRVALPRRTGASDSEQLPITTRGRAVVARERAERVPGDLRVVMAVVVDKAGGDDLAAGIEHLAGGAGQFADLGDLAVFDRDIAMERRHPRPVDDPAILYQHVVRHRRSLLYIPLHGYCCR